MMTAVRNICLGIVCSAVLCAGALAATKEGATMADTIGKRFPAFSADALDGTPTALPDSAAGKITLIVMAFRRESQSQLDSWLEPFAARYKGSSEHVFYELPMISTAWMFMAPVINSGMRAGIPRQKHGNVVTFYGNYDRYLEALAITDRELGYAFVLDRAGTIRWRSQGYATPETLTAMFAAVDALSASKDTPQAAR